MAAHDQPEFDRTRPPVLVVDVAGLRRIDMGDLGALVRLQLIARRFGASIELRNACPDITALLHFAGFSELLPCADASGPTGPPSGERRGQPEEREEVGVDEEVDPVDPAV